MPLPLSSRIALVTGASRGIGYATALALARAGAHIVVTARTVGGLEELDDAIKSAGSTATLVPFDLRDSEGIARLTPALDERFHKLDIFIGNAGVGGPSSPLDHVQPKDWDEVLAVNVTANWQLIRALNPLLQRSDAARVVFGHRRTGCARLSRSLLVPRPHRSAAAPTRLKMPQPKCASTCTARPHAHICYAPWSCPVKIL